MCVGSLVVLWLVSCAHNPRVTGSNIVLEAKCIDLVSLTTTGVGGRHSNLFACGCWLQKVDFS